MSLERPFSPTGARSPHHVPAAELAGEHLAAIVHSTDDAIASKDLNGIIQSWNHGAERLFGYTAEEAIGRPMAMIIPEERLVEEDIILARVRRGEKVDHMETVRRRKDGTPVHVSVTVSPVRDASGQVVGASKIARDISDRIEVETANAHLALIVESSDDAIVSKDLDGVVRTWNRGAERLFGYLAEEMIGRHIHVLLPPERQDEEPRILERLRRGERIDHFETVRVRKDGRLVDVSVTISPLRDRTGRVIGASKVARDIGDRKLLEAATARFTHELESRVQERTAELQAANREMEAFTYSIAHDIRAPLRAMVATSHILQEEFGAALPEEAKSLLDRQAASATYLAQLVDDLLRYSRLGKAKPKIERVDLTTIARTIVEETGSKAHDYAVEEGLVAQGDAGMLRLALQNLLDNAAKFSPSGGPIRVGRKGAAFFVQDEGMGFDMAYAEKVFVPFERLVRQEEVPGTGIGLASVRRIVEKHGGTVWASSVPGGGTTIYFTVPV